MPVDPPAAHPAGAGIAAGPTSPSSRVAAPAAYRETPREVSWNVMFCHVRRRKCHVLSCGAVSAGLSARALQPVSPAVGGEGRSQSCVPPSGQRAGQGCPCFARIAGGRGRVSAPARFARLIARARRRAHLARPFPPGAFSAPSRSLSAETPKGGPGSRLSLLSFYTIPPNVKPVREQKMKVPDIFHEMPAGGDRGDDGPCVAKPPETDA